MRKNIMNFQDKIKSELINLYEKNINKSDYIKIDLHCHDFNSDVPDETLARILRVPETWLPTEKLLEVLKRNKTDLITVTNHNNARTSWELLDKGYDVLVSAEFSCTLPIFNVGVHVLTYGFNKEQEIQLNKLRKNIYNFLEYTNINNIPTVLAHPLHFYSPDKQPPQELMDYFALLFERFEGLNGQRDTWQNLLTSTWIKDLTKEKIDNISKRIGIKPDQYCRNPYTKRLTGGSDCHMGIFTGSTGTYLYSPDWRNSGKKLSELALEALRNAPTVPYGVHCEEEKLTIAFIDYFCQMTINMKDPGLLRLLLHKGTTQDKLLGMTLVNAIYELRRHKHTSKFLKMFHNALNGEKINYLTYLLVNKSYKPIIKEIMNISKNVKKDVDIFLPSLQESLNKIFLDVNTLLANRITKKVNILNQIDKNIIENIEIPTNLRNIFGDSSNNLDLGNLIDGLPFPLLATIVLGAASFASSRVLYDARPFLNDFSHKLGKHEHPKRILWLTDTMNDKNGVSNVLKLIHKEVVKNNLPIDFLYCGEETKEPNIITVKPLLEFTPSFYKDQTIKIPNLMDIRKIFLDGGYDKIICSTEVPIGLVALFLKNAFHIPAYFYVHSDWITFCKSTLKLDGHQVDKVRRVLRMFYNQFDGLFLLNTEQKEYFSSSEMNIDKNKLFLTAHWVDSIFKAPVKRIKNKDPIILYSGRLAEEKGVMELPFIIKEIRKEIPNAKLVIAGTGPCSDILKQLLPEDEFLGWVDKEKLKELYSTSDLMIFPSWFDTFSCSLLEAISCGLPCIAYDTKGPRDILSEGVGILVKSKEEMVSESVKLLKNRSTLSKISKKSMMKSTKYGPKNIMKTLLNNVKMTYLD